MKKLQTARELRQQLAQATDPKTETKLLLQLLKAYQDALRGYT